MEFNHVNTAARVAGILGEAARHPGDRQSILDTWAKVFDVADEDPEVAAAAVFRRLVLLRDEIEAVRQAMVHTTVRPEKVKGPCDSARNATTIRNLEQAWSVAAQHIPPQVVNAFSIWADILPPEEEVVDEEVRSSLLEEIGHVREAALDDDISEDLRRFVLEQVNALERGVREYDVRGIGALRTAIYRVDGGLHIHFGAQPEADEPESVSALRRVYRKARMVAVQATLFTAAISGADDVAKIVGKTARYFLPPPAVEQADIAAPKPKAIDDGKGAVIGPTSQRRNRRTFRRTRDLHFQLEPAPVPIPPRSKGRRTGRARARRGGLLTPPAGRRRASATSRPGHLNSVPAPTNPGARAPLVASRGSSDVRSNRTG